MSATDSELSSENKKTPEATQMTHSSMASTDEGKTDVKSFESESSRELSSNGTKDDPVSVECSGGKELVLADDATGARKRRATESPPSYQESHSIASADPVDGSAGSEPTQFLFGSAKPQLPDKFLTNGGGEGTQRDENFWYCTNCPARSPLNLTVCLGCGSARARVEASTKQPGLKKRKSFEIRYFFGCGIDKVPDFVPK